MRDRLAVIACCVIAIVLLVFAMRDIDHQGEIADLRGFIASMPTAAAIRIEAQEMGVLYCPDGTRVLTTTEGITGGYRVSCRR